MIKQECKSVGLDVHGFKFVALQKFQCDRALFSGDSGDEIWGTDRNKASTREQGFVETPLCDPPVFRPENTSHQGLHTSRGVADQDRNCRECVV